MISIKTYAPFEKELKRLAKKYRSIPADYAQLLQDLTENPLLGKDLGKGILLYIYDKSDRSTVSDKEIIQLLRYIE